LNGITIIGGLQDNILRNLLSVRTLNKLLDAEAYEGKNSYRITELFADLRKGIWSELPGRRSIEIYRRNLQKSYINILSAILNPPATSSVSIGSLILTTSSSADKTDTKSVIIGHLTALRAEINAAANGNSDLMTRYHLKDLVNRIDKALNPKN
jgi:hypothetical protein